MAYKEIASYGIMGDLRTAAVATDGSNDWCCPPYFDSHSVFGAILDHEKGGFFRISPTEKTRQQRMYLPETNVLLTHFLDEEGVAEITDFMPIQWRQSDPERHDIIRQVAACAASFPSEWSAIRPSTNHLGLYAEEIEPAGDAVRNFPQAFTHLGPIDGAQCSIGCWTNGGFIKLWGGQFCHGNFARGRLSRRLLVLKP